MSVRASNLLLWLAVCGALACGDDDRPSTDAGADATADAAADAGQDSSHAIPDAAVDASTDGSTEDDATVQDGGDAQVAPSAPGLDARPLNATCVAWDPASPAPTALSLTGCFSTELPGEPLPALIPFEPIAKLWSDNASKRRWLAVPDDAFIRIGADGDFDFPNGTVLAKTFELFGRMIETRLLVRHSDGVWRGYAYEWNEAQTDATLLSDDEYLLNGKRLTGLGDTQQAWTIPSRAQCDRCHTSIAGNSLGLEVAQLNWDLTYPQTGRSSNQLQTLDAIGLFDTETPLGTPLSTLPRLSAFTGTASLEARARSYLHVNCSMCHREGGQPSCTGDFRYQVATADMGVCNITPLTNPIWPADVRLIKPGEPDKSVIALRMRAPSANDAIRMPPLGTEVLDHQGINIVEAWIRSLEDCQP